MIEKIISGGQTGADRGGLIAGKSLGLETGGTAPKGWKTEEGPYPALGHFYGLLEGPPGYTARTRININDGDATLIVGNVHSPGSQRTLQMCQLLGKPYRVNPTAEALKEWIVRNGIEVLNVAGNRESVTPGIQEKTFRLLRAALVATMHDKAGEGD